MAVLMTADIPGATKEMIDGMQPLLDEIVKQKGFVIHTNGPVAGGWRVVEVWDSQSDFETWFEAYVRPAFSEGGPMPVVTFNELNQVAAA